MAIEKDQVTEIPLVPLWTVGVILLLIIGTVILDFAFGTVTNIIILFMVTTILPVMILVLAVVPLDKFADYLGFDVGKHKWMTIVHIIIGLSVGTGMYFLFAKPMASIGVIPLPMGYILYATAINIQAEISLTLIGIFIMALIIATGEEMMRKFIADAFGSRIPKIAKTRNKITIILVGFMLSGLIWSLAHFGNFTVVEAYPIQSYIMLYIVGIMFVMPGMIGFMLKGTRYYFPEYIIWSPLMAHLIYDIFMFSDKYLASVAPTSFLALIL